MRLIVPVLALAAFAAQAQTAPLVQEPQPLQPRKNQKVERIHVEDSAVAIDEVRYAGQTQSITVQPKGDMPAYEILPANPARSGDSRPGNKGGERVWNVFSF
ncbi:hypothetical protein [Ramlibacter sp. PS4R-6]|uniref:hypothetical protein n=1 Tax=Ramlibacter sp. PS4R-6 TaxID=3133438 RepID=UPI0030A9E0B0